MRRKRLKKTENRFYECVLEFNYATIKGFAEPNCKNRCTLMDSMKMRIDEPLLWIAQTGKKG
jgi:hypothetical protein